MSSAPAPLRIALACSGLGHIRRGNEAWARDVGTALHRAGVDVTLFGGGPHPEADCPYVRVPNLRRDFPLLRRWVPWSKRYLAEQLSFLPPLRRLLRRRGFRSVHLCDPDLALQLHKRTSPDRLRVAFKDGMLLGPQWCRRLPFIQVLAPYYRDVVARDAGVDTRDWFVIPHLVDPELFQPATDRAAARSLLPELRLPAGAFVVLGVGDFSANGNKRLDWLVRELAALPPGIPAHLVLAGQADPETLERFAATARQALGDRVHLLRNQTRDRMRLLYRAADVFAHAALTEPFGIVFLEAMASGLPPVGHPWEVTRWIIGDAGETVDMTSPGALAGLLNRWADTPALRADLANRARRRVLEHFTADRLVPRYVEMHERMAGQ